MSRELTPEMVAIEVQGFIDEYKKWGFEFVAHEPWVNDGSTINVIHDDHLDEIGTVDL